MAFIYKKKSFHRPFAATKTLTGLQKKRQKSYHRSTSDRLSSTQVFCKNKYFCNIFRSDFDWWMDDGLDGCGFCEYKTFHGSSIWEWDIGHPDERYIGPP